MFGLLPTCLKYDYDYYQEVQVTFKCVQSHYCIYLNKSDPFSYFSSIRKCNVNLWTVQMQWLATTPRVSPGVVTLSTGQVATNFPLQKYRGLMESLVKGLMFCWQSCRQLYKWIRPAPIHTPVKWSAWFDMITICYLPPIKGTRKLHRSV